MNYKYIPANYHLIWFDSCLDELYCIDWLITATILDPKKCVVVGWIVGDIIKWKKNYINYELFEFPNKQEIRRYLKIKAKKEKKTIIFWDEEIK